MRRVAIRIDYAEAEHFNWRMGQNTSLCCPGYRLIHNSRDLGMDAGIAS